MKLKNFFYKNSKSQHLWFQLCVSCSLSFAELPPQVGEMLSLEMLNLWSNHIEELPTSLSSLPKLRILNLGCAFFVVVVASSSVLVVANDTNWHA